MKRHFLVSLLLVTGVALGEQKLGHAAVAPEAQAQAREAPQQQKETQAKLKPPQDGSADAQTKKAQEKAKELPADAQAPTAQSTAAAQTEKKEQPQAQTDQDSKLTSVPGSKALGMSILGNQEAPKALVIVPWKSSDVGRAPGISPMLDDSRQPIDKEAFMRALRYYEIKSQTKP